jgi:hypothetical protein
VEGGLAGARGPIPAPEVWDGELLDVGLVRLPVAPEAIPAVFGPNLERARVLLDDAAGTATRICAQARELYARGRGLSPAERRERRHAIARNLARMRARAGEPGPFFEALAYVFYLAHRCWYEVLHDRWSESVHRAMPEIRRADPEFHDLLLALIDAPSPAAKIAAAEAIDRRLFGAEAAKPRA